jgi:hypothetical protein
MANTVEPLYREDKSLSTDAVEQAKILFKGTSVIPTKCDLSDVGNLVANATDDFPPVTEMEVNRDIDSLPPKKAVGPDYIPNELLKAGKRQLSTFLAPLFSSCLRTHHFPRAWRTATTAIIRKADKPDYRDPNAYRPIALLCTLGKLFEKVINERLTHWIDANNILPPSRMGGRRGRNIIDALLLLTSWIKNQWRNRNIVAGIFLDVKSAYPTVYKDRLCSRLKDLSCPPYLTGIVHSFLSNGSTAMRLGDYTSPPFDIPKGLPQGSPLSVTLDILYNSNLLIQNAASLSDDKISIGYVDDVVHLVAAPSVDRVTIEQRALRRCIS